jgi:DNA-binding protein H-NS
VKVADLESMTTDELWELHEKIRAILSKKMESEKTLLEVRIKELQGKLGITSDRAPRRPYPKVDPKFRNPELPHQTWSGRGKQPKWVDVQLKTGKTLDDLAVTPGWTSKFKNKTRPD